MSGNGAKKDKSFIAMLILIIVCACLMVAAVTTLGVGLSQGGETSGTSGSHWWTSADGDRTDALGADGDFYLDADGNVYQKKDGAWGDVIVNLKGPAGAQGAQGVAGQTPYIGENGHWWIGEGDEKVDLGVSATGIMPDITVDSEGFWLVNGERVTSNGKEVRALHTFEVRDGKWVIDGEETDYLAIGEATVEGTTWLSGEGTPEDTEGEVGDFYLDTKAGQTAVWKKQSGGWRMLVSLVVDSDESLAGPRWFYNNGDPKEYFGTEQDKAPGAKDGDFYVDVTNGDVYQMSGGSWGESVFTMAKHDDVGAGKDGTMWYTGVYDVATIYGDSKNALYNVLRNAKIGDFYFNTLARVIYKKTVSNNLADDWQKQCDFNGTAGKDGTMWYNGVVGPEEYFGEDPNDKIELHEGDFYINTDSHEVWHYVMSQDEDGTLKWVSLGNLNGTNGSKWHHGEGAPVAGQPEGVQAGDYYLNDASGEVYCYDGSSWGDVIAELKGVAGATGPTGPGGAAGSDGKSTAWHHGQGKPAGTLGAEGDYYLDTVSGEVYKKVKDATTDDSWEPQNVTLRGTQWYSDAGTPVQRPTAWEGAQKGDFYFDTQGFGIWKYDGSSWGDSPIATLTGGSSSSPSEGTNDSYIFTGTGAPTDANNHAFDDRKPATGDLYFDEDARTLYRCTRGVDDDNQTAAWSAAISLKGDRGNAWFGGFGVPVTSLEEEGNGKVYVAGAQEGDHYVDTKTGDIYKYESAAWKRDGNDVDGYANVRGPRGVMWFTEDEYPEKPTEGVLEGDLWLSLKGEVFRYSNGAWADEASFSIKGDQGDATVWYYGTDPVESHDFGGDVNVGDFYLDSTTWNVYQYVASCTGNSAMEHDASQEKHWCPIGNIKGTPGIQGEAGEPGGQGPAGPDGKRGNMWFTESLGGNTPSDGWKPESFTGELQDGDLVLDTSTGYVFEYTESTKKWTLATSLHGGSWLNSDDEKTGEPTVDAEGNVTPAKAKVGDYYLWKTEDENGPHAWLYVLEQKGETKAWRKLFDLNGAPGVDGAVWFVGALGEEADALPSDDDVANAKVGDFYYDTTLNRIYQKTESGWEKKAQIENGKDGRDGTKWTTGHGAPSVAAENVGDLYLDLESFDIYKYVEKHEADVVLPKDETCSQDEPNSAAHWHKIGNIKGENGEGYTGRPTQWFAGNLAEAPASGFIAGDLFLDVMTGDLYKYSDGSWGDSIGCIRPHIDETTGNWFIGDQDLGISARGPQGADGLTPEIGSNGNWFIGKTDTGVAARGPQGADGTTPHIGENGNWFIGKTDTGVAAKGADGQDGLTPHMEKRADGVLVWAIGDTVTDIPVSGINGKDGNMWFHDDGVPVDHKVTLEDLKAHPGQAVTYPGVAHNGDFYFDDMSGTIYVYTKSENAAEGTWRKQVSLIPEINEDGYWVVNGETTDVCAKADLWTIGEDDFWYLNGEKTEHRATPDVKIGDDGYWYINGDKTDFRVNTILSGMGKPDPADGINGDLYVDIQNAKVYKKENNEWSQDPLDLKGADGKEGARGSKWFVHSGDPNNLSPEEAALAFGSEELKLNDLYLDLSSEVHQVYQYNGNTWELVQGLELKAKNGIRGSKWFVGRGDPGAQDDSFFGTDLLDGDYYLDATTGNIWRFDKAEGEDGSWSSTGYSLKGEKGDRGATWWTAKSDSNQSRPTEAQGVRVGDFLFATLSGNVYQYQKINEGKNDWVYIANIKGANGTVWHLGEEADPNMIPGLLLNESNFGDFYLSTKTYEFYKFEYTGGKLQWTYIGSLHATVWFNGTGEPGPENEAVKDAIKGDYYIDNANGNYYQYNGTGWDPLGCMYGASTKWHLGEGEPTADTDGVKDDFYLRTDATYLTLGEGLAAKELYGLGVYQKVDNTTWKLVAVIESIPANADKAVFTGHSNGAPTNAADVKGATIGDLYIDLDSGDLYTCQTAPTSDSDVGVWMAVGNVNSTQGTLWIVGVGAPDAEGLDKDLAAKLEAAAVGSLYLDTSDSKNIYVKEEGNTWRYVGSLVARRGTKVYYNYPNPNTIDTGIDSKTDDPRITDSQEGDIYFQRFNAFDGKKGFVMWALEKAVVGSEVSENGLYWHDIINMTSEAPASEAVNIPDLDTLRSFRNAINDETRNANFKGRTFNITGNIVVTESDWEPIKDFYGTLNGDDHTIVMPNCANPIFDTFSREGGAAKIDKLNVVISHGEDANLNTHLDVAAHAYFIANSLKNLTITNSTVTNEFKAQAGSSLTVGELDVTTVWGDTMSKCTATYAPKANAAAASIALTSVPTVTLDNVLFFSNLIDKEKVGVVRSDIAYVFKDLKFTGMSYIDVTDIKSLVLDNCYADVDPIEACLRDETGKAILETEGLSLSGAYGKERSGSPAFIVSRNPETDRAVGVDITVKDSVILSAQSKGELNDAATFGRQGPDSDSMAIYVRVKVGTVNITGNVFGADSDEERYTVAAVKFASMGENAVLTFTDNFIYGGADCAAFALSDKDATDVYVAKFTLNIVDLTKGGTGSFLSITGKGHAQVYLGDEMYGLSKGETSSHSDATKNTFNDAKNLFKAIDYNEDGTGFDFIAFDAFYADELPRYNLSDGYVYLGDNFGAGHQFTPANLYDMVATPSFNHDVWIIDLAFDDPLGFVQHVADYTDHYYVNNEFGLASFRDMVNGIGAYAEKTPNTFSGKYIVTTKDIDIAGFNWIPIGTTDRPFSGKFTTKYGDTLNAIQNLTIDVTAENYVANEDTDTNIGLFGYLANSAELFDIEIAGVNINAKFDMSYSLGKYSRVGALVANANGANIHDVKVSGNIQIESKRVNTTSAVIGQNPRNLSGITVDAAKGSCIKMYGVGQNYYIGGIVGHAGGKHDFSNLHVTNLKIMGGSQVGGLIGLIYTGSTVSNSTLENVHLYNGDLENNNTLSSWAQQVGAVAGGWIAGTGDTITIQGVTFQGTGDTAGVIERGEHKSGYTVSKSLCGGGYVGGHHTDCRGANVDYSDSGNNIYALIDTDLYYRNGDYEIMSAHGLQRFADIVTKHATYHDSVEGHTATLMADIDLSVLKDASGNWLTAKDKVPAGSEGNAYKYVLTPIGDATKTFMGTFDGNHKTITGLTNSLFAYTEGATIKNLVLENVAIDSNEANVGALIGEATDTKVQTVSVTAPGHAASISGKYNVGGLIGVSHGATKLTDIFVYNTKVIMTAEDAEDMEHARSIGGIVGAAEGELTLGAVYFGGVIENAYKFGGLNYLVYNYGLVGSALEGAATDEWANGKDVFPAATVTVDAVAASGKNATLGGATYTAASEAHVAATDLWIYASEFTGTIAHGKANVVVMVKREGSLNSISELVNHGVSFAGETVAIVKDIDMSSTGTNWQPIGTEAHPFEGTFNGFGSTIAHLNSELFGYTDGAKITDVKLGNIVAIAEDHKVGTLVNVANNTKISEVSIEAFTQELNDNKTALASDVASAPFGIVRTMTGTTTISVANITIHFDYANVVFNAKVGNAEDLTNRDAVVTYTGDEFTGSASEHTYNAVITDEIFRLGGFNTDVNANMPKVVFTFTGIKFTGNSFIQLCASTLEGNRPNVTELAVKNCFADVTPDRAQGLNGSGAVSYKRQPAFIVGYERWNAHNSTQLIVTNNVILSENSVDSDYSDAALAIFSWSPLADGTVISGNVFGSEERPFHNAVIKILDFQSDLEKPAKFTIEGNTFYVDGAHVTEHKAAIDLAPSQKVAYEVWVKNNTLNIATAEGAAADYTLVSAESAGGTKSRVFITKDNTVNVNGTAVKLDFDLVTSASEFGKFDFIGYNVVLDDDDKITSGDFIFGNNTDRFATTGHDELATALSDYVVDPETNPNIHIVIGEQFGRRLSDLLAETPDYNTYYNFALEGVKTFINLVNSGAWNGTGKTVKFSDELAVEIGGNEAKYEFSAKEFATEVLGSSNWTPIGTSTHSFAGTFDGSYGENGVWMIKDLTYTGAAENVGFFGYTTGATLRNLEFVGGSINFATNVTDGATRSTGILVGYATGGKISNITIHGVKVEEKVASLTGYVGNVGSVAGTVVNTTISNIHVSDVVIDTQSTPNVGGVVGVATNATLYDIYVGVTEKTESTEGAEPTKSYVSDGSVSVTGASKVGGVVGVAEGAITLGGVADVEDPSVYSGAVLKASSVTNTTMLQIGGIIGALTANGVSNEFKVTDAHFVGTLTRTGWKGATSTYYANYGLVGGYTTNVTGTLTIKNSNLLVSHHAEFIQDTKWNENSEVTSEYQVTGVDGFKFFRDQVNGGNSYKDETIHLVTDIDLDNKEWQPIGYDPKVVANGTPEYVFEGTFTGKKDATESYTISNLQVLGHVKHTEPEACVDGNNMGLFGRTRGATIEFLNIKGAKVTGHYGVGVIVGTAKGTNFRNITVENAVVKGHSYIGGIVGHNDSNVGLGAKEIKDCRVIGLEASAIPEKILQADENPAFDYGAKVGGIVGFSLGTPLTGCSVTSAKITAYKDLGGLVGIDNTTGVPAKYTNNIVKDTVLTVKRTGYTEEDPDGLAGYKSEYAHVDAAKGQHIDWMVGRVNDKVTANVAQGQGVNVEGGDFNNTRDNVTVNYSDTEEAKGFIYDNFAWHILTPEGLKTFHDVFEQSTGNWDGNIVDFASQPVMLECDVNLNELATVATASLLREGGAANWDPIGKSGQWFNGTFNGKGHMISNMVIDQSAEGHVGFFSHLNDSAVVKDLKFVNANVSGKAPVGVLAGVIGGNGKTNTIEISNITIEGNVTVTASDESGEFAGGLTGILNANTVSNITINADEGGLVSGARNVGGLAGSWENKAPAGEAISLNGCNITIDVEARGKAGGVVGTITGNVSAKAVTVHGDVAISEGSTENTPVVAGFGSKMSNDGVAKIEEFNFEGDLEENDVAKTAKAPILYTGNGAESDVKDSESKVTNDQNNPAAEDENVTHFFYGEIVDKEGKSYKGYIIDSAEALKEFAYIVNEGIKDFSVENEEDMENQKVLLAADIDLSQLKGAWTPIGTDAHRFMGTFDGMGYTISNINVTGSQYVGLFGMVGDINNKDVTPEIRNLKIGGNNQIVINAVAPNNRTDSGILVGYAANTKFTNITVDTTDVNGVETNVSVYAYFGNPGAQFLYGCTVGGLVGASQSNTYNNITFTPFHGYVLADAGFTVGGVIGLSMNDNIDTMTVNNVTVHGAAAVGGVIGANYNNVSMKNVHVTNTTVNLAMLVTWNKPDAEYTLVGGLIGAAHSGTVTIEDCSFAGNIETLVPDDKIVNLGLVGGTAFFYGNATEPNLDIKSATVNVTVKTYLEHDDFAIQGSITDKKPTIDSLEISSAAGLTYFAQLVNGGYDFAGSTVTLAQNIDLGGVEWTPIGTEKNPFSGKFNGNGHTISNLKITSAEGDNVGLFGFIGYKAGGPFNQDISVENFTLENVDINVAGAGVGAVVGYANGHSGDSTKIIFSNITVTGDVNVKAGGDFAGGFAGHLFNANLNGIHVNVTSGKIVSNASDDDNSKPWIGQAGGIAGHMSGVVATDISSNIDVEAQWAGAFTGCLEAVSLDEATLSGNITGKTAYVGAVAGSISDGTNTLNDVHFTEGIVTTEAGLCFTDHVIIGDRYSESAKLVVTNSFVSFTVSDGYSETTAWDEKGATTEKVTISNANGLATFRDYVNGSEKVAARDYAGVTVELGSDITLSGNWTPIGGTVGHLQENSDGKFTYICDNPFRGTFDGQNNTISGLKIEGGDYVGLFGYTDGEAKIMNVTLDAPVVTGGNCVGTLVGHAHGTTEVSGVTVTDPTVKGVDSVGGIVGGYFPSAVVSDVIVSGKISIQGNYKVGGVVGGGYGNIKTATVDGTSFANSRIEAIYLEEDLEGDNVGGIIGYTGEGNYEYSGLTVKNVTVSGTRKVGGALGYLNGSGAYVTDVTVEDVNVDNSAFAPFGYKESKIDGLFVGAVIGEFASGCGAVTNANVSGTIVNTDYTYVSGAQGGFKPSEIVGGSRTEGATLNLVNAKVENVWIANYMQIDKVEEINSVKKVTAVSVYTAEQLCTVGDYFNHNDIINLFAKGEGRNFVINLRADIDMDDNVIYQHYRTMDWYGREYNWTAIDGHWVTFNGNGHTIKNMIAMADSLGRAGLFGYAGGNEIHDLTLENFTAYGTQVGTFSGHSYDTQTITNSYLKGTVNLIWSRKNPTIHADDFTEKCCGIGAITGINGAGSSYGVTIDKDCVVTISFDGDFESDFTNNGKYLVGYSAGDPNFGDAVNNGEIKVQQNGVDIEDYALVYSTVYDGVYVVYTANGLAAFRDIVNDGKMNFAGKTVALDRDIDLQDVENGGGGANWTPIGTTEHPFFGTFDGNGYTISNLVNTSGNSELGLFGVASQYEGLNGGKVVNAYIKNLKLENVTLKGASHVAGVVGTLVYGGLENITVSGNIHIVAKTHAAAVVGLCYGELRDIHVDGGNGVKGIDVGATWNIHATQKVAGGIVGGFAGTGLSDLSAEHISVFVDGVNEEAPSSTDVGYAGGIAGVVVETSVDASNLEVRDVKVGAGATNGAAAQQETAAKNAGAVLGAVIGGGVTVKNYYVSTDSEIVDENQQTVVKAEGEKQVPEMGNEAPVVGGANADKVIPQEEVIWLYTDTEGLVQVMKGPKNDYSGSTLVKVEVLDETGLGNLANAIQKNYTADIYLVKDKVYTMTEHNFTSIGDTSDLGKVNPDSYKGHFYGNGATIVGLTKPIFGNVDGGAVIEDLTLGAKGTDEVVSGYGVAWVECAPWSGTIELVNCVNNVNVEASTKRACAFFVGTKGTSTVIMRNCVNNGNLFSDPDQPMTGTNGNHAAGFIGYVQGSRVELYDCINNGDINVASSGDGRHNIGGFISTLQSGSGHILENCENHGNITGNMMKEGGTANVGGLIGRINNFSVRITNCVNTGNVTANVAETLTSGNANAGALAGMKDNGTDNLITIENCRLSGKITSNNVGTGTCYTGAIFGNFDKAGVVNATGLLIEVELSKINADSNGLSGNTDYRGSLIVDLLQIKNSTLTLVYASDEDGKAGFTQDFSWDDAGVVTVGDYHIYNLAGLKAFRDSVNAGNNYAGRTVYLEAEEIDLGNEEWTPIGTKDSPFHGYFDGNNHTISNLTINDETMSYVGLFGVVSGDNVAGKMGAISNLKLDQVNVTGFAYVGALTGESNSGAVFTNITVTNLTLKGNQYVAAISGHSFSAKAVGCTVEQFTIECLPNQLESGEYDNGDKVGGIMGYTEYYGAIDCTVSDGSIRGFRDIGGIIGYLNHVSDDGAAYAWNCTVSDVKIIVDRTNNYGDKMLNAHEIVGCLVPCKSGTHELEKDNVAENVTFEFVNVPNITDESGNLHIYSVDGLKAFRDSVNGTGDFAEAGANGYSRKTVYLEVDVDLNNEPWTPIGTTVKFTGNFDGQNHTISNLVVEGNVSLSSRDSSRGLFASTYTGTIKNFVVNNAKVTGGLDVAVIASNPGTTDFDHITITGHVEVNAFAYAGLIGGHYCYGDYTNITVDVDETSYIRGISTVGKDAYRTYVGGIIGHDGEENNLLENIYCNIDVFGDVCDIGGIAGLNHNNTISKCVYEGTITVTSNADGAFTETGGIAGTYLQTATFEDCTFNGTIVIPEEHGDYELVNSMFVGSAYNSTSILVLKGTNMVNGQAFIG